MAGIAYLAARRAGVAEIAYVVVETRDDDDLADRMWEANRKHGVQYTRGQRKVYGVKLHGRGLPTKRDCRASWRKHCGLSGAGQKHCGKRRGAYETSAF